MLQLSALMSQVHKLIGALHSLDEETFNNIPRWLEYVKEERGNEVIIYLVANKIDLTD